MKRPYKNTVNLLHSLSLQWTQWNQLDAAIHNRTTETKETKTQKTLQKAPAVGRADGAPRGRASRASGTINQTRKEGRGLYGRAPPIYWLHIIAASQIINPASRGYMETCDASPLPSIKHTGRLFGFSFPLHPCYSLCSIKATGNFPVGVVTRLFSHSSPEPRFYQPLR